MRDPFSGAPASESPGLYAGDREALQRLTEVAAAALRAPVAQINTVTETEEISLSSTGPGRWAACGSGPLESSYCRHVISGGEPLRIEDARQHPLVRENPATTEGGVVAYAAVPLAGHGGEVLGSLCVLDFEPRRWTDADVRLLEHLGGFAVAEMTRRRQAEEAVRRGDARFRSLIRHAPDLIVILSAGGLAMYQSPSVEAVLGYAPGEIVDLFSLVHPDDVDTVTRAFGEVVAEPGKALSLRFRVGHRSGGWRVLETTATNLLSDPAVAGVVVNSRDVTERARAEQALRESEERFRQMAENVEQIFSLAEVRPKRFLYVSPAYERVFGRSPETLYADPDSWIEAVHPDDRERVAAEIGFDPIGGYDVEYCIVRPDGAVRWIRDRAFPVREGGEQTHRRASITEDVTARRSAREQLRRSEERYRLMIEGSAQVFFYTHDPEGRFQYLSPSVEKLLGYAPEELRGQPYSVLLTSDPANQEVYTETERALQGGDTPSTYVALTRHKDGHEVPMELVESSLVEGGEVVGVQGFARDIRERRHAEEELLRSRNFYLSVLEHFPALIWRCDQDGSCDYFNRTWLDFTGRALDDELAEGWAEGVHPEDRNDRVALVRDALAKRESFEMEYRLRHHSGEYRWIRDLGRPLYDPAGEFVGFIGAGFQTHEQRVLEQQLRVAQRMEGLGRLAGGIAHDFNNILGVIGGTAELLLLDVPEGEAIRQDIEEIKRSSDRAADLTRQLLAFSRQHVVQPEVIDLNEIITGTEKMLRRTVGADVEFVTILDEDLGYVEADPTQVEQLLMNLLVNARDAMPEGGKVVTETRNIEVTPGHRRDPEQALAPGPYVLLRVSDTGEGIAPEALERIFDPFFSTKDPGKGTGLGLAIVYGIVQQSDGHITVESEVGKGTSFEICLPRLGTPEVPMDQEPDAAADELRGSGTILLAEDQDALRSVVRRTLERGGYTVIEAANGEEALRMARLEDGPIDLLLTDVVMPLMSGTELAEAIRRERPETRILLMSGYAAGQVLQDEHGVRADILLKPFAPVEVLTRVHEMISVSNA